MKKRWLVLYSLGWLMLASTATTPVFADIVFSTSGSTSGGAVSGSADFSASATDLFVTLVNTSSIHDAANVLTGFNFTLTGGTGITLIGVSPTSFQDCTSLPCTTISQSTAISEGLGSAPLFGWQQSGSFVLAAGNGSLKPGGIINPGDVQSNANSSVTGNHNPYLGGPVTFEFSFINAPTNVTAATIVWGTGNETTTGTLSGSGGTLRGGGGTVPEPSSILLLVTVCVGLTTIWRKKAQRRA